MHFVLSQQKEIIARDREAEAKKLEVKVQEREAKARRKDEDVNRKEAEAHRLEEDARQFLATVTEQEEDLRRRKAAFAELMKVERLRIVSANRESVRSTSSTGTAKNSAGLKNNEGKDTGRKEPGNQWNEG